MEEEELQIFEKHKYRKPTTYKLYIYEIEYTNEVKRAYDKIILRKQITDEELYDDVETSKIIIFQQNKWLEIVEKRIIDILTAFVEEIEISYNLSMEDVKLIQFRTEVSVELAIDLDLKEMENQNKKKRKS